MRLRVDAPFACLLCACVLIVGEPARALRADQGPERRGLTPVSEPVLLTKIEALLATPDTVLTTDYYRVDLRLGPGLTVDAVVVTAVDLQTRVKGLRIGLRDDTKQAARSESSFLDIEEAVSLSKALASIAQIASRWAGQEGQRSTDLSFTTIGGFAVDVHESGRVQAAVLSSGFRDPVRLPIELTDFASLKQAVDQALATLSSK